MISSHSNKLNQISPLSAKRPQPASPPQPEKPEPPKDEVEIKASKKSPESAWAKVGLGLILAGSAASAFVGPAQMEVLKQLLPGSGGGGLSLTDMLRYQGYAGDSAVEREQTTQTIYDNMNVFDSPSGHDDGKIGISDLERVAEADNVAPAVSDSAKAVLADPILLNSLDVARGDKVDHVISDGDLQKALSYEDGGYFGTFAEMESRLYNTQYEGQNAFDYFDSLSGDNDKFNWHDLNTTLQSPAAPDPFKDLAHDLTANPTYMNAFDVASAHNSPTLFENYFDSAQRRDGTVSAEDLQEIAYAPLPESGRQFTEADQAALDRILGDAELGDDIFRDFYQTDRGNCVSTAVIKAAMDRFGDDIFKNVEKLANGSYRITMRDGFQLDISPSELEAAATAAHFQGDHAETKSLATLSYAAMAKRAWAMGHEGAQTYGQALLTLNDGEIAKYVPTYLGLKENVHSISREEVKNTQGAVVYGNGHAYFVDNVNGEMHGDKWGSETVWEGRTFVNDGELQNGAFIIK